MCIHLPFTKHTKIFMFIIYFSFMQFTHNFRHQIKPNIRELYLLISFHIKSLLVSLAEVAGSIYNMIFFLHGTKQEGSSVFLVPTMMTTFSKGWIMEVIENKFKQNCQWQLWVEVFLQSSEKWKLRVIRCWLMQRLWWWVILCTSINDNNNI